MPVSLEKDLDIARMESGLRDFWETRGVYRFDPQSDKPVYSVDTPPPYVSAAHLHVGHAMSYTQAEILVRYKRMRGFNVFYPMGFDDNGLPTERYVEKTHKIDRRTITRSDFRKLCMEETARGAVAYEKLWRAMGLSVDWRLSYSTIDDRSRHTAQKSFLDLYRKGLLQRANEPVLWDVVFETSLAQADLETMTRKGKLYDIRFAAPDGTPLVISTTRPELIPACVALFANPDDGRYAHLVGTRAKVPLFDYDVPILASEDVEAGFGTGLMMCCTFGDGEDVKKWKQHNLDTRTLVQPNGKLGDLAGPYAGLSLEEARKRIVADLAAADLIVGDKTVEQNVSVGERSGAPVEFIMAPQWFINVLDHKPRLLARAQELQWYPEWMKVRLEQWIDGLKYNWNISRQRFYGVPFPVWYVQETGEVILADDAMLPVDPIEDAPPAWAVEKYKGLTIVPETDVMDTWMTSSLTPQINANWAGRADVVGDARLYPMSLRVQAFEIIRTWLFYTLVKADYHGDGLPWKDVMISGWGLNEQGKKISKRDLEAYTDASGFNRYDPYSLTEKYGADAIRYWAASSQLGHDLRFNERDVKDGRKIVVKLWNVARLAFTYMKDYDPATHPVPVSARPVEDQWILRELDRTVAEMTASLEVYDYATARETLNRFFWSQYCDDYLEIVKGRFWQALGWTEQDRRAAQATLQETLRTLLALFAPYLPYVTEEIYQRANRFGEPTESLHLAAWPEVAQADSPEIPGITLLRELLHATRKLRSERRIGAGLLLKEVVLDVRDAPPETVRLLAGLTRNLQAALRTEQVREGALEAGTEVGGIKVEIVAYPEGLAPTISSVLPEMGAD